MSLKRKYTTVVLRYFCDWNSVSQYVRRLSTPCLYSSSKYKSSLRSSTKAVYFAVFFFFFFFRGLKVKVTFISQEINIKIWKKKYFDRHLFFLILLIILSDASDIYWDPGWPIHLNQDIVFGFFFSIYLHCIGAIAEITDRDKVSAWPESTGNSRENVFLVIWVNWSFDHLSIRLSF